MDCPRCHATLYRSRDEEAAGECLQCGPIYVPVASPQELEAQARADAYPLGPRQRVRDARPGQHGITLDGCDEAPSCLDCPLPECKFVGIDANTCDVCGSVFATRPALVSHRKGCTEAPPERTEPMNPNPSQIAENPQAFRTLSTIELGSQCIASLRELKKLHTMATDRLRQIQAEAEKLITIATFAGADVPEDLRELAATRRPKSPSKCPKCGTMCVSAFGLRIHDARKHPVSWPAAE